MLGLALDPDARLIALPGAYGLSDGLAALVADATLAVRNVILGRTLVLSDQSLLLFTNVLGATGKISDESGNLLPDFFSRLGGAVFWEVDGPACHNAIRAVLDLPELEGCVHGRSVRADALSSLADLLAENPDFSETMIRRALLSQFDQRTLRKLLEGAIAFRWTVRDAERNSTQPPPGDRIWTRWYYEPISTFEAFAEAAILKGGR